MQLEMNITAVWATCLSPVFAGKKTLPLEKVSMRMLFPALNRSSWPCNFSAEDWNHELVYWILNSLEKADTMDISDVRDGRIPLRNDSFVAEMKRLNCYLNDLARQLWEDPFSEEEGFIMLDPLSVGNTFRKIGKSCKDKFSNELKNLLGRRFLGSIDVASRKTAFDLRYGNVRFGWQGISLFTIMDYGYDVLGALMNKWLNEKSAKVNTSEKNFIISTSLMYYFYYGFRSYPLCYQATKRFTILDLVFEVAATFGDVIMMKKVLDCGARLWTTDTRTVLHTALYADVREDKLLDMVTICLQKFERKAEKWLVNAADQKGMTALHLAALQGKARVAELLIQHGAEPDVRDTTGRLPLHYAVEKEKEQVIDLLIGKSVSEYFDKKGIFRMLSVKNYDGQTPLDAAVAQNNIKLMTKLLPISEETVESYFDRVDRVKLLHELAFQGRANIVEILLGRGLNPQSVDKEGKTALHFAAMCRDYYSARTTISVILDNCKDEKALKEMVDWEGKTAFHFLALNGNVDFGISMFGDLLDRKDIYDRGPLYYFLQSENDRVVVLRIYIKEMEKIGMYFGNLVDSTGQTPLHVAALEGKIYQVDCLLSLSRNPKTYVRRADYLGQTALHKAAGRGHLDTIKVLIHWGAQPLIERDCDGRTAMHYAVQAKSQNGRKEVAELLLKKCGSDDRKLLFLWASAAGLGTAEQILDDSDSLKKYILDQKKQLSESRYSRVERKNLLRIAACIGDTDMTKELLARGGQITDIEDQEWIKTLEPEVKSNVHKVLGELHTIAEQGNDQPTAEDKLGRDDFAWSLAALLLNPYLEPPIAVGISGRWGKGKSSLMVQTEINILKTAAQSLLLPISKLSLESSFPEPQAMELSTFPGAQVMELSAKGKQKLKELKSWVDFVKNDSNFNTNILSMTIIHFREWIKSIIKKRSRAKESQVKDSLFVFLDNYDRKYHAIFKSLAAMDTSEMFSSQGQKPSKSIESLSKRNVPTVLTVQYNAWLYRNESEALAGLAVEITKEMEGIMTEPQRMSTCLRNSWRKQKQSIWTELLFPCILAIFLAGMFTWILWTLLNRYDAKEAVQLKYASLPATIVVTVWTLVKSVMSVAKPVSTQLMNYINLPDHSEKLGYQERVISDINFLKEEIGKKPYFVCTVISCILLYITECCRLSFLYPKFYRDLVTSAKAVMGFTSYASVNPRIVVFVDDLDRCQESVILQILSAINLVLAVCKISVIVGMDKALIERAIIKKYGDKSVKNNQQLADKYLQKIIQLPLDLPDPSEKESKRFLDTQLGVFSRSNMNESPEVDGHHNVQAEADRDYDALFSVLDKQLEIQDLGDHLMKICSPDSLMHDTELEGESSDSVTINVANVANADSSRQPENVLDSNGNGSLKPDAGNQCFRVSISIREILFVRYSEGERDAFCHFQKMATDLRKLPREWKRLLAYHRLVWYILYVGNQVNSFLGWQVQLITWVFTCWEWQENMNIIIENWKSIGILKDSRSDSSKPSLRAIVEHFIKEESRIKEDSKDENVPVATNESDSVRFEQDSEDKEPNVMDLKQKSVSKETQDPQSSNSKLNQAEEIVKEEPTMRNPRESTSEGERKHISEHIEIKDLKDKSISENFKDPENSKTKIDQVEEIIKEKPTMTDPHEEKEIPQHSENKEAAPETVVEGKNICISSDIPESSEGLRSNEVLKDQMMRETDGDADFFERKSSAMSQKLEDIVENVREELKKAIRDEIEKSSRKEMEELHKEIDKLYMEIKEIKEVKQQSGKNKEEEERKTRLKEWKRMRSALRRYDVSMEGIIAFQRFRFYCVADYLPWPLPNEETEDLRFLPKAR